MIGLLKLWPSESLWSSSLGRLELLGGRESPFPEIRRDHCVWCAESIWRIGCRGGNQEKI